MPPLPTPRHALFLDFDGTLADIAAQPQAVQVPPDVFASLRALHPALGGALAIVTGRTLADMERFLAPLAPLRLPLACEHGAHHGPNDPDAAPPLALQPVLAALQPLLRQHPALLLEHKRAGFALHYRQAPQLQALCRQTLADALRGVPDAELMQGHCVLEVKPAAASKGRAIARFMRQPPFAGRVPLFVGDDVTDEAGFAAVQALGGLGVKVGTVGAGHTPATQALARLPGPAAVRAWLRAGAQALSTPSATPECAP